ncbi:MAG: 6-carboxytetrahydropterin synthase [Tidjanibacter sp.]|nr:6-carboxytetrahydropterin synthase [Tidjanibacter sp.]
MSSLRLTKLFRLEMAHALVGYDGLCNQIHGHSYRFEVTVESDAVQTEEGAKMGMALDFGEIKSVVERTVVAQFDHSLTLRRCAETEEILNVLCRHFERINAVEWQPTCENLLAHFAGLIAPHLPEGVRLYSLRLHETEHNCAELVL